MLAARLKSSTSSRNILGAVLNNPIVTAVKRAIENEQVNASDSRIRFPREFQETAIEAIARNQMMFRSPEERSVGYDERAKRQQELEQRIARLTKVFNRTPYVETYDAGPDLSNGGRILRFIINVDKIDPRGSDIPLSNREKAVAFQAIYQKASWMGYLRKSEQPSNEKQVVVTVPKYTPPTSKL